MTEAKGPLDRAADRLGELVRTLKNGIIPGLRPKDQKAILDYLLEMTDDLMAAKEEIDKHKISENERQRIIDNVTREWSTEMDKKLEQDRIKWNTRIREAVQENERKVRTEFNDWIIQSHIGDPDD
jgi:uncharacterized membrane protein YheB (UPF0754 family)